MIGVSNQKDIDRISQYWIHLKNGTHVSMRRRMTLYAGEPIVREIRFDNIYLAESGMYAVTRLLNKIRPKWKAAYSQLAMVKEAHENITPGSRCKLYRFMDGYRPGVTIDWVGKPKKHWKNLEIGNRYAIIDTRLLKCHSLLGAAREVFRQAIAKWATENYKLPYSDGVQKITINGRDYYFKRTWPHRDKTHVELELLSAFGDRHSTYHELEL